MITRYIQNFAQINNCAEGEEDPTCLTDLPTVAANNSSVTAILSIVFGVLTAVAVIVIVIQGIKFVLSQGDPDKAANARRGIIYAVVGLLVCLVADTVIILILNDVL